jgi:hypothetical protein
MWTNPKPDNLVSITRTDSAIVDVDPNRIDRWYVLQRFEVQTGVIGILHEEFIRFAGLALNRNGQAAKRCAKSL